MRLAFKAQPSCGPMLANLNDVSFLVRKLGLSEPQAREIGALQASLGASLSDCCSNHCLARARLGAALAAETAADTARADAIVEEMCRAYEAGERASLAHIRTVRSLLTPEQRERFNRMLADTVCSSCTECAVNRSADENAGRR
jgi:hypothetical protein